MSSFKDHQMTKKENNTLWTAANVLSLLRILLIPVFLIMMILHKSLNALVIFLIAGSTDLLDGLVARIWHQKTKIGTFLDPAADKLLLTAAFVILTIPSLSSPNVIPLWLTIVVIGRDVLMALSALILLKLTDQRVFYPTLLGKISTFCQVGVVFLILFFNYTETSPTFLWLIYYLTLTLTVLSGIHYGYVGVRIIKKRAYASIAAR